MKLSSEDLKAKVLASTGPNGQKILRRVIVAGQQVLFDKQTHQQAFTGITENPGKSVANLMLILYDKSRPGQAQPAAQPAQPTGLINAQAGQPAPQAASSSATMPRGSLIPASAVLLANVIEFSGKAGIKKVDDAEFSKELEEMVVIIMDRFNPEFRKTVASKTGKIGAETQPPTVPPGGIINNAGAQP